MSYLSFCRLFFVFAVFSWRTIVFFDNTNEKFLSIIAVPLIFQLSPLFRLQKRFLSGIMGVSNYKN